MHADGLKIRLDAEAAIRSKSLTDLALARLWRDRLSMLAIAILLFLTLASIAAPR